MNKNAQFDGYVSDSAYTSGYYRTQSPANLALAMLARGFMPPNMSSFKYLELGFGQGLGLNIHGAGSKNEFWGSDFNAQHAANAQGLASASGANMNILSDSFQELLERKDLPNFDFITMHGVWSWIADKNREEIVEILKRKLNPGGVLQISFNCQPGWATMVPLQHLIKLHKELTADSAPNSREGLRAAILFIDSLAKTDAAFFKAFPDAKEKLEWLKSQDLNYLVHEIYNDNWPVMPFSEVAKSLEGAKLGFVCPSNLLDHLDVFSLSAEHRKFVNSVGNAVFRETIRDYCMNRRFRSDVFAKGARVLSVQERNDILRKLRFVLLHNPDNLDFEKISLGTGRTISLKKELASPIINALASNELAPKTVAELEADKHVGKLTFAQLAEMLIALAGADVIAPAQSDDDISAAKVHCDQLNTELLRRAEFEVQSNMLASPIAGAGLSCSRIHQLFLGAMKEGKNSESGWIDHAWKKLKAQGHSFLRDGKPVTEEKENLRIMAEEAKSFKDHRLAIFKAHQIL
jgi:SAM-dependent methyltransferase